VKTEKPTAPFEKLHRIQSNNLTHLTPETLINCSQEMSVETRD
jgi:hypothetical protein